MAVSKGARSARLILAPGIAAGIDEVDRLAGGLGLGDGVVVEIGDDVLVGAHLVAGAAHEIGGVQIWVVQQTLIAF